MCRILGSFAAGVTAPELDAVSGRQRHGGPDERGVLSGRGWSLGCDRLAVTDPGHGSQPYRLRTAPGVLAVLNGEIYNHRELRRRLSARGHRFDDLCDGSLLPALYMEYGPEFAAHLDGMFAVAVLDLGRPRPRLVLAVDDMGMKPIHYHVSGDGSVRFASEIPALLAFDAVPADIREESLDSVLATKTPLGTETALRGVHVLPPGATAVASPGSVLRIGRRAGADGRSPHAGTGVLETLRHETARLTAADVPVCAVTSGGLDSGLVTALAAEELHGEDRQLHTFHLGYQGRWPDAEHTYARAVANRAGTVHHRVDIDPAELASLLTRTVRHLGQPNADPIALSTYALFRAVREAGFTVALTGDGADELFGGYDRVRRAMEVPDGQDWTAAYVDALAAAPRLLRHHLYTPAYRAFINDLGSDSDRIAARLRRSTGDRLSTLSEFETGCRLPAYHLRRVDHLSMACAVEARMPFCQPATVAMARSRSAGERTGKRALYEAGRGLLPATVLRRPKQPFTLPLAAMLAPGSPLLESVRELLSPAKLARDGRLRPDRVQALLARHIDHPSASDALALWAIAVHELWTEVVQGLRRPVDCAA
ncbi:asparagine synthase (glutamine-hydrolyzing) [Streptomyces sp. NBC_01020]|uniref:asparagine synthase (glutamine-hydrolyzing) n=1 Tax=unclassified Streptomyces TaxID=2593676 RepID=UPI00324B290A|nr:asparagine synthase (glutamine-hydrolyzing) [Streptomyces sp. NBC_01020]